MVLAIDPVCLVHSVADVETVRFQIKSYAPEAVIFDTASGDTHYLSPIAHACYQVSRDHPGLHRDEIKTQVIARFEYDNDPGFANLIDEAISSLRGIGLLQAL
jgi:PqqD family protein of HPr-rel-A system